MKQKRSGKQPQFLMWRFRFVIIGFLLIISALVARMVYLTVINRSFLEHQGNVRYLRTKSIPAYRGMITDRNGDPLAVSTPVDSVWVNPQDFPGTFKSEKKIGQLLHLSSGYIANMLHRHAKGQFVYIKRGINPQLGQAISQLAIPGVYLEREYKRYYPQAETASQVVGFTNIDDQGQAGLELLYNDWLQGEPGKERVLKDRYGHIVAVLDDLKSAKPGHDLRLSLDNRIQFDAYRVLKETVKKFRAESGSVVVLNPKTGEILAMVNQPSFNPNKRPAHDAGQFRNRAVTDMFEPGSTMKAFSVASALDSGKYKPDSKIDTSPGWFKVGKNIVRDDFRNNGVITVNQVLQRSSNVGVAKMTLSLPPEHFIDLLHRVGFGERTRSGFPGEGSGFIREHLKWRPFVLATLAFGYGISVTPLQLAQAYSVIANQGLKCPATFLAADKLPACDRVMNTDVANAMLHMLEKVLEPGGTGVRARVLGYKVAGKTGTAYIAGAHGYNHHRLMASFVGIAPVNNPQLIVAVIIRAPQSQHFGGLVAAPAFSKIMRDALSILNIPPGEKSA